MSGELTLLDIPTPLVWLTRDELAARYGYDRVPNPHPVRKRSVGPSRNVFRVEFNTLTAAIWMQLRYWRYWPGPPSPFPVWPWRGL